MRSLPKSYSLLPDGCFLAGGAILSAVTKTDTNDYDIYPKSKQALVDAFFYLIEECGCFVVNISDRAVTLKSNNDVNDKGERVLVQVMTYDTFETAEKIFDNFDFTVCMAAFDGDTKEYTFHPDFFPDVAAKTLRFNPGTKYPFNSILRLLKYQAKGYIIGKSELIRMILTAIERGAPTSWKDIENQIGGVYGRQISLNMDDKPFSIAAAVDFFADVNLDFAYGNQVDYSGVDAETLESIYGDGMPVVVSNDGALYRIDLATMTINKMVSRVRTGFEMTNANTFNVPDPKMILINENEETRLYGYKVLLPLEDGSYAPGVMSKKETRYRLGESTSEQKSPYLFVFNKFDSAKNRLGTGKGVICRVSYNAKDIKKMSYGEIQVTELKLEEIIEQKEGDNNGNY